MMLDVFIAWFVRVFSVYSFPQNPMCYTRLRHKLSTALSCSLEVTAQVVWQHVVLRCLGPRWNIPHQEAELIAYDYHRIVDMIWLSVSYPYMMIISRLLWNTLEPLNIISWTDHEQYWNIPESWVKVRPSWTSALVLVCFLWTVASQRSKQWLERHSMTHTFATSDCMPQVLVQWAIHLPTSPLLAWRPNLTLSEMSNTKELWYAQDTSTMLK